MGDGCCELKFFPTAYSQVTCKTKPCFRGRHSLGGQSQLPLQGLREILSPTQAKHIKGKRGRRTCGSFDCITRHHQYWTFSRDAEINTFTPCNQSRVKTSFFANYMLTLQHQIALSFGSNALLWPTCKIIRFFNQPRKNSYKNDFTLNPTSFCHFQNDETKMKYFGKKMGMRHTMSKYNEILRNNRTKILALKVPHREKKYHGILRASECEYPLLYLLWYTSSISQDVLKVPWPR